MLLVGQEWLSSKAQRWSLINQKCSFRIILIGSLPKENPRKWEHKTQIFTLRKTPTNCNLKLFSRERTSIKKTQPATIFWISCGFCSIAYDFPPCFPSFFVLITCQVEGKWLTENSFDVTAQQWICTNRKHKLFGSLRQNCSSMFAEMVRNKANLNERSNMTRTKKCSCWLLTVFA